MMKGKIKSILLAGLSLLAGITLVAWLLRCSNEVEVSIGHMASKDIALRTAIPKLAGAIQKCPEATRYRIIWEGPVTPGYDGAIAQSLMYIRERKRLGYERDLYSGFAEDPVIVDVTAIQEVAQQGGSFDDFKQYDQKSRK